MTAGVLSHPRLDGTLPEVSGGAQRPSHDRRVALITGATRASVSRPPGSSWSWDTSSTPARATSNEAAEGRLDVLAHNAGVLGDEGPRRPHGPARLRHQRGRDRARHGGGAPAAAQIVEPRRGHRVEQRRVWAVTNPDRPECHLPLALYSASKAAATRPTLQYAKSQPGIRFNALEPGTTATDLTAAFGIGRPPAESARVVVRLSTLGPDGPTGTLQDEDGELPW